MNQSMVIDLTGDSDGDSSSLYATPKKKSRGSSTNQLSSPQQTQTPQNTPQAQYKCTICDNDMIKYAAPLLSKDGRIACNCNNSSKYPVAEHFTPPPIVKKKFTSTLSIENGSPSYKIISISITDEIFCRLENIFLNKRNDQCYRRGLPYDKLKV